MNRRFSYIAIGLFFIILIYYMYSRRTTQTNIVVMNERQNDKLAVKRAIETWDKKLNRSTKMNILLSRKPIKNDILVAKTIVNTFTFQQIDATITLYPVFDTLSTKDKTIALIHEIGHILGIGIRWNNCEKLTKDQYPLTIKEFNTKFGKNLDFINVKDGHWNEPELVDDIMSASGSENKTISSITIANLRDLGWEI